MCFKEMERALNQVKDNLIVQGELLNRLDRAMIDSRQDFDERSTTLLTIAEKHEQRLDLMQSAMHSLFERMDRFIRGLESDGHKKRGKA